MSGLHSRVVSLFIIFICILSCMSKVQDEKSNGADSKEFHAQHADDRGHLLAHISDRMDLDGEGLRHIKSHLGKLLGEAGSKDADDIEKGDNAKGIFYFFKLHDYDNNDKLDGLELLSALTDFHEEDNVQDDKVGGRNFAQEEAVKIADELLEKHDKNKDGMIDFPELMDSKANSLMTDLDKDIEKNIETKQPGH